MYAACSSAAPFESHYNTRLAFRKVPCDIELREHLSRVGNESLCLKLEL
jgi:hypothetical protein